MQKNFFMDNNGKQTLLRHVIEYALLFQKQRRHRNLSANDINDAIHALGLRPLLSSLDISGNDAVNPADLVTEPLTGDNHMKVSLRIDVPFEAQWVPPTDNFRKRKWPQRGEQAQSVTLAERERFVVDTVVNICHTGGSLPTGISAKETLTAAWMLGLHFSDLVSNSVSGKIVPWQFVRNAIWFLHRAISTFSILNSNRSETDLYRNIFAPWEAGLVALSEGRSAIACESGEQRMLIEKTCSNLLAQISP
jgi:hypothetical protein